MQEVRISQCVREASESHGGFFSFIAARISFLNPMPRNKERYIKKEADTKHQLKDQHIKVSFNHKIG